MKKIMDSILQAARSPLLGNRESGRVTAEYAVGVVAIVGVGMAVRRFYIDPIDTAKIARQIIHWLEWLFGLVRMWMGW